MVEPKFMFTPVNSVMGMCHTSYPTQMLMGSSQGFVGLGFLFFITQDDIKTFVHPSPGNI